jgi:hypothetical protein
MVGINMMMTRSATTMTGTISTLHDMICEDSSSMLSYIYIYIYTGVGFNI